MEQATQKQICSFLDSAAGRCHSVGKPAATGKQCWFLAKLILEIGYDYSEFVTNTNKLLTKNEASRMIGSILEEKEAA